ncbi:MAG: DUF2496 domain-containing protein, partial [Proteus mirabilis]
DPNTVLEALEIVRVDYEKKRDNQTAN